MRRLVSSSLAALVVSALAGCSAKLTGSIQLDGAPFAVSSCKSGEPMGFAGVELSNGAKRIRLVALPDGSAGAIVFDHGDKGDDLGPCGTLQIHPQNSQINSVTNVEGRTTLACEGAHKLSGTLEFANCH